MKSFFLALDEVIENVIVFRSMEGDSIKIDLENNSNLISQLLKEVVTLSKKHSAKLKDSLNKKINHLIVDLDKNRLEQEVIYYLEKIDINEEIIRLKKHIELFTKTINQKSPKGKKLNFICQEIGREVNTIGSKCSEFQIQSSVINMKEYLEKIKEENFNIL